MVLAWGVALRASAETAKRLLAGTLESEAKCMHARLTVDHFPAWNLSSNKLLWTHSLLHQYPQRGTQGLAEVPLELNVERTYSDRSTESVSGERAVDEERNRGAEEVGTAPGKAKTQRREPKSSFLPPKSQVLGPDEHPLDGNSISSATWNVLRGLRKGGFQAYLVGGGVRDLYLGRTPKDYDILSDAYVGKVKSIFGSRAILIGKRYPICLVRFREETIEVSSAHTAVRTKSKSIDPEGWKHAKWEDDMLQAKNRLAEEQGWPEADKMRWENAMKRDFTVNGLMYDPFSKTLYDYVGGLRDMKKGQVRTIAPPMLSFAYDPARMVRALRVAARLKFALEPNTAKALQELLESNQHLIGPSRRQQELSIMMEHGAAELSMRMLWRYDCLKLFLPLHDEYFTRVGFSRRARKSNKLLDLLTTLDQTASPGQPCDTCTWGAVLALHLSIAHLEPKREAIAAMAFAIDSAEWDHSVAHALNVHKRITGSPGQSSQATRDDAMALLEGACTAMIELHTVRGKVPSPMTQRSFDEAMRLLRRPTSKKLNKPSQRSPDPRDSPDRMDDLAFTLSRILLNTIYPKEEDKREKAAVESSTTKAAVKDHCEGKSEKQQQSEPG